MRRTAILWLGLVVVALPAAATGAPSPSAIVPSRAIGPFHLGMTSQQFDVARRTALCGPDVRAVFEQRQVARLETNCGGAYRTETRITVGMDPSRMLRIFGTPERIISSNMGGTRGEWLQYLRFGIAFRVVYADVGYGLIQAIAVFRGTAPWKAPTDLFSPEGPPEPPPGLN
jgi:hypothetical protein